MTKYIHRKNGILAIFIVLVIFPILIIIFKINNPKSNCITIQIHISLNDEFENLIHENPPWLKQTSITRSKKGLSLWKICVLWKYSDEATEEMKSKIIINLLSWAKEHTSIRQAIIIHEGAENPPVYLDSEWPIDKMNN